MLAGEAESSGGFGGYLARWRQQLQRLILRRKLKIDVELGVFRDDERFRSCPNFPFSLDGNAIATRFDFRKSESSIRGGCGVIFRLFRVGVKSDGGIGNG